MRPPSIAAKFDLAIASTKGMSVTAFRQLLDQIQTDGPVDVYALHDMDITGRTIFGTLTTDGRRYAFDNAIEIHDLGLRYEDVVEMGLEPEPFDLGKQDVAKVRETLKRHGASKGEIAMLLGPAAPRRVERHDVGPVHCLPGAPPDRVRRHEGDPRYDDAAEGLAPGSRSPAVGGKG